jgi:hypothetical protein
VRSPVIPSVAKRSRGTLARTLALVATVTAGPASAETLVVLGATMPDGAQKVGENRVRAREDWETTLNKFFRYAYPVATYPRKNIVNQPGVKAVHIANPTRKGWEGMNIYLSNEEVRIYVIPAPDSLKAAKKRPDAGKPKGSGR